MRRFLDPDVIDRMVRKYPKKIGPPALAQDGVICS